LEARSVVDQPLRDSQHFAHRHKPSSATAVTPLCKHVACDVGDIVVFLSSKGIRGLVSGVVYDIRIE
jgi:hypothetical protein